MYAESWLQQALGSMLSAIYKLIVRTCISSSRDVNAAVKRQLIYPAKHDRRELARGVNGATPSYKLQALALVVIQRCLCLCSLLVPYTLPNSLRYCFLFFRCCWAQGVYADLADQKIRQLRQTLVLSRISNDTQRHIQIAKAAYPSP